MKTNRFCLSYHVVLFLLVGMVACGKLQAKPTPIPTRASSVNGVLEYPTQKFLHYSRQKP